MGRPPKFQLNEILSSDIFRYMRSINLVDEIELRNLIIKEDYKELRICYNSSMAIEKLMEKYCISDTTIIHILYHNKAKKNKPANFSPDSSLSPTTMQQACKQHD